MTMEFLPGVWYPIETAPIDTWALFGNVNWEVQGKRKYMLGQLSALGKADCLTEKGDFTAWSPIPPLGEVKTSKPKLPTVPEFIWADQLKPGDLLQIYDYDHLLVVTGIAPKDQQILPKYPIYAASTNFSSQGLIQYSRQGYSNIINHGNKDDDHIIRIERNGVTVAEGQVYDD